MYIIKHVLECAYNNKYCAYYTNIIYCIILLSHVKIKWNETNLLNFSHRNMLSLSSSDEN